MMQEEEILVRWSDLHRFSRFLKEEMTEIGSESSYVHKAKSSKESEHRVISASEENMGLIFFTITELIKIAWNVSGIPANSEMNEDEVLDLANNTILSKNTVSTLQAIRKMRNKVHNHSVTPPERFWYASNDFINVLPKTIKELEEAFLKINIILPNSSSGQGL